VLQGIREEIRVIILRRTGRATGAGPTVRAPGGPAGTVLAGPWPERPSDIGRAQQVGSAGPQEPPTDTAEPPTGRTELAADRAEQGSPDDAGMSTVEYAVGTVVAAAFAAVLYRIVTGDSVVAGLTNLINSALSTSF